MLAALIVVSALCVYVIWQNTRMAESMRLSLVKEQAQRMKERRLAWQYEQYLITLAYSAKPDLAAALANVPPPELEEPPEEPMHFDGWGPGRTGK